MDGPVNSASSTTMRVGRTCARVSCAARSDNRAAPAILAAGARRGPAERRVTAAHEHQRATRTADGGGAQPVGR